MSDQTTITPGEKLRRAREAQLPPVTRRDLAALREKKTSYNLVTQYELGRAKPPRDLLALVAERWRIPLAWFYDGQDTAVPSPITISVPPGSAPPAPVDVRFGMEPGVGRRMFKVLGSVGAAAVPIRSSDADPDDWMDFSDDLYAPERFALRIRGNSMKPFVEDGWYVLVQPSPVTEYGFATVYENGEAEYTLKMHRKGPSGPFGHSLNRAESEDVILKEGWKVVGYVVGRKCKRGTRYFEEGDPNGMYVEDSP